MIASHNQVSIEKAVALVQRHGMNPTASGVFFGQLLGMADHLTLVLGGNGYRVSIFVTLYTLRVLKSEACSMLGLPQSWSCVCAGL